MQPYLKLMGVDTWSLRNNIPSALPACYAFELFFQGQSVGLMLAEASAESDAIEDLLNKMIAALKCQSQGRWYAAQPDCSNVSDLRFVVVLGDALVTDEFDLPVIRSHAPQQLLAQPKLKPETWQAMQAVFPCLPQ